MMKYFSISELCKSDTADSRNIDNVPNEDIIKNLNTLVEKVLDPARETFGSPITVTSGYRSPELNSAVRGSKTSQHMRGQAADLVCSDNARLFDIIKDDLEFDQLIWENHGAWVHVSYNEGHNRKQVLNLEQS